MNCFDCGTQGIREEAVGTCVNCGAGMCAAHARTEERHLEPSTSLGNPVHASTRTLLCTACDQVMAHHRSLIPVG
jgi:hypothetical protein